MKRVQRFGMLSLRPQPMAVADDRAVNLGRLGDEAVDVNNFWRVSCGVPWLLPVQGLSPNERDLFLLLAGWSALKTDLDYS
jgi:hypothetical protein